MRSPEERRALHMTPPKVRKGSIGKGANSERIVQMNGAIYRESKVDGKTLYIEVKTTKDQL